MLSVPSGLAPAVSAGAEESRSSPPNRPPPTGSAAVAAGLAGPADSRHTHSWCPGCSCSPSSPAGHSCSCSSCRSRNSVGLRCSLCRRSRRAGELPRRTDRRRVLAGARPFGVCSPAVCVVLTMLLGILVALLMRQRRAGPAHPRLGGAAAGVGDATLSATIVWGWILTRSTVCERVLARSVCRSRGTRRLIDPLSFFFVATIIIVWVPCPSSPSRCTPASRRSRMRCSKPRSSMGRGPCNGSGS